MAIHWSMTKVNQAGKLTMIWLSKPPPNCTIISLSTNARNRLQQSETDNSGNLVEHDQKLAKPEEANNA